jgi:hypothetical protein
VPPINLDREGHGFEPCRKAPAQINPASAAEEEPATEAKDVIPNRAEVVREARWPIQAVLWLEWGSSRVGQTPPTDLDREGHGLSRAAKLPPKLTRLQPLRRNLRLSIQRSSKAGLVRGPQQWDWSSGIVLMNEERNAI